MTSQRPITYREVFKMFVDGGHPSDAGTTIEFRNNTELRIANAVRTDTDSVIFDVVLYGELIARLYSDGGVRVWDAGKQTNTTKNRLNDVLVPIGWKLRSVNGNWKVFPCTGGTSRDFRSTMILDRITK